MGAVCCAGSSQMPDVPRKESMVLYADFFDSDTRTLLAMTEIIQADLKHEQVDRSKQEAAMGIEAGEAEEGGQTEGAADQVAAEAFPRICQGLKTISGGDNQWQEMFEHFFEQCFIAKRTFCPQEFKTAIDQQAVWFKQNLRPNTLLLTNLLPKQATTTADVANADTEAVGAEEAEGKDDSKDQIENTLQVFFDTHMIALEKKVEQHGGVCCETITYMDLMIYNEIRTVLVLYGTKLKKKETPSLHNWFENINELCPPVAELDQKFDKVCKEKGIGIKKDGYSSN